jgi:hypothetical protein
MSDENAKAPTPEVIPDVSLKEDFWVRIGDDSFPVHKVRSVSLKKSKSEYADGDAYWGLVALLVILAIIGGILSIWIPMPFGFVIVGFLAIPLSIWAILDFRKSAAAERIKEFQDVFLALDKNNAEIHIASRIPKQDAEKIRTNIEETVARASKEKPN